MAIDAMRIGVQIRRFLVISFKLCYRSVCKHPFLVGMVCYLLLLYRSFPFLFSLLVTASPVLICTAILLGTLLSFGEPNIPEIEEEEEEEEVSHEISYLKKEGVAEDATFVVQKDESFSLEGFVRNKDIEEESLLENKNKKIEVHGDLGDYVPLIDETSREVQFEKLVVEEVESDFDNLELGKKREIQEENLGIKEVLSHAEGVKEQYSLLQNPRDENLDDDNSVGEFIATQNGYLEFSQESSWKRAYHDDDEASDSGSDGVESSSPDASMADILPMLDELHPLLDEEAPQPANISNDGSDAGSEGSHKSDESSIESEEDVGNQADEDEDGDDDNDNDNDNDNEEEAQGSKEDESKSAIKWTEDDQKNLMDLGTLEIERNQRLESLIARRRARRNMRLMAEKNLIDLDAADIPINIPSISTTRHNPFDFPYDDVPGSAPSVLLPRRNPFDLPYDSNEEKPDLKGDSFQQEFSATQHREPFFRRHESFSVGPSTLGGTRQDLRWKPYFVPERFATEGTSYHTFQRQLSEASESKVSSVPDTESVSSALEEEDKRINEEDVSEETEMISNVDHASLLVERGSLSSEEVDSLDDEQVEKRDLHLDGAEIGFGDVENHQDIDSGLSESGGATPEELNTSEILLRMGRGEEDYSSRSSLSSLSEIDEKISDVNRGSTSLEPRNSQIEGSHISTQTSLDSDFHFVNGLADDNEYREPILEPRNDHIDECDISTQSSLDSDFHFTSQMMVESQYREPGLDSTGNQIGDSGILKEISMESDSNVMSGLPDDNQEPVLESGGHHIEESGISLQTYHNSDIHLTTAVTDDGQHSNPVYDSSPQSIETFLSFSSFSSDTQRSEMGSPLATAEFADKDSEVHAENLEKDMSSHQVMLEGSSQAHSPDEIEFRSTGVAENTGNEIAVLGFSGVEINFDGQKGYTKPESAAENVSVDYSSLSDNGSAKEVVAGMEENSHHKEDRLHSSTSDADTIVDGYMQLDSASSSYNMASEEINLPVLEKDPPLVVGQVSLDTKLSASEAKPVEDHAIGIEKTFGLEQDQISSTSFDADIHADGFQAVDERLYLVDSNSQHVPSNDLHLSVHEEGEPSVVAEQVLGTHLDESSLEMKLVEEHSSEKGETIQSVQDQVHSSISDSVIGAGFHRDVDVTIVSSESGHQNALFEEKSHLESEKQQSLSDKSIPEQSSSNHDEPQGQSVTISNNENIPEVHNPEERISRSTTSLMSNFTSDSPNSLPYKSPDGGMDLKDDVRDKIVYEDYHQVLEHSNYPGEAYGPPVAEENINEEEDEIKEIDDGLLSELDTVGDFSVTEVVGESLHDEQVPENSVSPEFDFLPKDSSLTEVKPELPVLEARSVEDIDLAFKQFREGANAVEVIVPSMFEEQLAEDESKHQNDSDLRVVEASSSEDIHIAMKKISEEKIEELVDSREATTEANEMGSTKEIPVLEFKTIEDIDLAFRQLHEGVEVEEVIVHSAIEQQLDVDGTKDLGQTSSAFPVAEARSLEDIHIAMKQVSEGNVEQQPKLLDPNYKPGHEAASTREMDYRNSEINEEDSTEDIESSTVEVNEVSSIKAVESSTVQVIEVTSIKESEPATAEFGVVGTSTISPHESKHGFDETSGNSSSSIPDTKGKKAKSHSSSSSSSSSSSDSD
ncbi:Uro-adherence factor [Salix suchowensis]|nr:Uro-adherence factor [Salix suchowensis]